MAEGTERFQGLFDTGIISRIRRNHGLEHATLHVLAERNPGRPMAGHSDLSGFWIIGNFSSEEIGLAVDEALARLQAGESRLAVHPSCGTNFATAGVLAGLAAGSAMFGVGKRPRENFDRLPMAVMLATLALIVAQPVGLVLQEKVTTSGAPGGLRVLEIRPRSQGSLRAHRIITEG